MSSDKKENSTGDYEEIAEFENEVKCVLKYKNNIRVEEIWFKNGLKHRDGNYPAYIAYHKSGNKEREEYFVNGLLHRTADMPAVVSYDEDCNTEEEEWWVNGKRHRENDKPASVEYYRSGRCRCEIWFNNDQKHRENDKPAWIGFYVNGNVSSAAWYINGKCHRDNLPAVIEFGKNGFRRSEEYYIDGVHRSTTILDTRPNDGVIYLDDSWVKVLSNLYLCKLIHAPLD